MYNAGLEFTFKAWASMLEFTLQRGQAKQSV